MASLALGHALRSDQLSYILTYSNMEAKFIVMFSLALAHRAHMANGLYRVVGFCTVGKFGFFSHD